MPAHDWTRTNAGTFHAFHLAWIAEIQRALNRGLLPHGYYALAEQVAGEIIPDVLTLQEQDAPGFSPEPFSSDGGGGSTMLAVADAPPRVSVVDSISEMDRLTARQRHLVIRHTTGDRIVALIEIVSPGNKERRVALEAFIDKAAAALEAGYHLLILDLLPPGPLDPRGMHGALWKEVSGREYEPPAGKPLTLAAYAAGALLRCYVEPLAAGDALVDMPLFLDAAHYVNVPLEQTYGAAWEGVPQRWQRVIEGR